MNQEGNSPEKIRHDEERKSEILKINNAVKIVVFCILFVWLWNFLWLIFLEQGDRGTFGDMFGGINALFSGLAFVGIIYAVLLQRKELENQREELELQRLELKATRQELAGQKEALEEQNKTLETQRFENKFFQLLNSQRELTNSLYFTVNNQTGIDGFRNTFHSIRGNPSFKDQVRTKDDLPGWLEANEEKYLLPIKQYFNSLKNLWKFLDDSDASYSTIDDISFYSNILKSCLSVYEIFCIGIYCYSRQSDADFKDYVSRFQLMEGLPTTHSKFLNSLFEEL
jgi:hypothetical protein